MSNTQVTGLPLGIAGDSLYNALPLMQKRVAEEHGAKDLAVDVIMGDVCDQTVFNGVTGPAMRLSVHLLHEDGIGDVAQSTFRACTYALFTILREQMRHASVREGSKRLIPAGTRLEVGMPIGESDLTMLLEVL